MTFNPFQCATDQDLPPSELQRLVDNRVAEGYYVEYKSQPVDHGKIAHSIASFANTYGGWYFIGVKTDAHNVATAVPGFPVADLPDPIATIRDLIRSRVSPCPVFSVRVTHLDPGRIVVTVHVPDGQETPFVTTDGRIYRRTHDSSDPVYETDRSAVDLIVQRGQAVVATFDAFARDERHLTQSEDKDPRVSVYLSPYPDHSVRIEDIDTVELQRSLLQRSRIARPFLAEQLGTSWTGHLPFNTVTPSGPALWLRQVHDNRDAFSGIAVRIDVQGRCKIHFPILTLRVNQDLSSVSAAVAGKLASYSADSQRVYVRPFDVAAVFLTGLSLLEFYQGWIQERAAFPSYRVAVAADGIWRTMPFFDHESWCAYVDEFGLPVNSSDSGRHPEHVRGGFYVPSDGHIWLTVCPIIGMLLGLPRELSSKAVTRELLSKAILSGEGE